GPLERTPCQQLVLAGVGDLRVPLHPGPRRALGDPVGAPVARLPHLLEVVHHARQVLEVTPEAEHLGKGLLDGDALAHDHARLVAVALEHALGHPLAATPHAFAHVARALAHAALAVTHERHSYRLAPCALQQHVTAER